MEETTSTCGAVILAGGHSRRMGTCKALLKLDGKTMLERTAEQLACFDEVLLSANDPALGAGLEVRIVPDIWRECGPLGGLHAALAATQKDALFCVPCDLPRFTAELPRMLLERMEPEADAILCRDGAGRLHPLCGIYRRRVCPVLEEQLSQGRRRMTDLTEKLRCQILETGGLLPDSVFWNMNTPESYLRRRFET